MTARNFVVKNGLDVTEVAIIRDTTDSSSKDTGALIVEGGVGIEKKLYVGTELNVDGITNLTGNATLSGDIAVNGGDITTNQTTFNLINTTATTLNVGGAATTLNVGATTGTTNVRNNLNVTGDLDIDGGDLTSSTTTFNLVNTTATTLNIGGAATALNLGAATGTLTVNNAQTVFNSTDSIKLPTGTIAQRDSTPEAGQIRYNSELSTFEGYGPGNFWGSLGGVRDVDRDTYIIPETSPGADTDRLDFYTGGTLSLSLNATTLDVKIGTTLVVTNDTEASSTTTGSVQIAGGVGIAKRLYAGSIENTPIGVSARNTALFTTLGANGQVTFNAGTASTTTTTGSVVVSGGVGITGAINTGASSTFAGFSSTSTTTISPANASVTISPTGTGTVTINPATTGSINNINIGATTAGTGAFTTLTASSTVTLSPANASVTISPTGTGTVTINPATTGTINNTSIGATTASTGRFTTVTSTVATGTAPLTVASTTVVTNLNADLLDGFNSAQASTASTVVVRDADSDITSRTYHAELADTNLISGAMVYRVNNSSDNILRYCNDTAAIRTFLDVPTRSGGNATGTWAISISGNAATATTATNQSGGTVAATTGSFSQNITVGTGTAVDPSNVSGFAAGQITEPATGFSAPGIAIGSGTGQRGAIVYGSGLMYFGSETGSDNTMNTRATLSNTGVFSATSFSGAGTGLTGTAASLSIGGNAATATSATSASVAANISNTGTVTLATATESNAITITAPSYTTDRPVKLLNFDWYGNIWSLSNIRSGGTASNGLGIYYTTGVSINIEVARFTQSGLNLGPLTLTAGNIVETSSIRYKENVKPIDNALEKVLQLQGVTYDRKNGTTKNEPGMIAEEVAKVIPNLVKHDDEGLVDGIHYSKTVAYLVECIKELNAKIERLEGKLNA